MIVTDRWGLTVPYFGTLIEAKNASFFGDFRRPGIEVGNGPENEASLSAIRPQKEGAQMGGGLVAISP